MLADLTGHNGIGRLTRYVRIMNPARNTPVRNTEEGPVQQRPRNRGQCAVASVLVDALLPADSPRLAGEDVDHVRALAESEATLPPIIVHRPTMRVIDGMHRLRAATLRGDREIEACFFEGAEGDAFVLAVEANIAHGLPLSLADRKAAAGRIIRSHPHWSDRAIAACTGLAGKTVGAIRRGSTEQGTHTNTRIGRDGRVRPLDAAEGRAIAGRLLAEHPETPLRDVADRAGISLGTAHDVRERLRRGETPVPVTRRRAGRGSRQGSDAAVLPASSPILPPADPASIMRKLIRDPSLRFSEAGRNLLRLFHVLTVGSAEWSRLIGNLPSHTRPVVAEAARACAKAWLDLAEQLERG